MKVLVVHNRYRSALPSGENRAVDAEITMLREAGVEVVTYLRSSDEIDHLSPTAKLTLPLQPIRGRAALADIGQLLRVEKPDVLHLHNPYPFVSLSVVRLAHRHGVPVVETVHNHRHSCMRGSYYRDGHDCRLCEGRPTPWPAVRHGCYRDSRVQSLPMAVAFRLHRADQVAVDRYVALSAPIEESLLASGLVRSDQVVLRPNTVPDPGPAGPPGRGALFVGRLTEEKGVDLLLDAWEQIRTLTPPVPTLTVVGDGPLRALLDDRAARPGSRIVVRGTLDPSEVAEEMRACAVVVVPSRSPEALPLVVLESLAHGRPVLVTRDSGLDAIVDASLGRAVSATAEDIAAGLHDLATADLAEHGEAARKRYDRIYSPAVVLAAQLAVYESVMAPRVDRPRSDQAQA